jgi:hypothetical protein
LAWKLTTFFSPVLFLLKERAFSSPLLKIIQERRYYARRIARLQEKTFNFPENPKTSGINNFTGA